MLNKSPNHKRKTENKYTMKVHISFREICTADNPEWDHVSLVSISLPSDKRIPQMHVKPQIEQTSKKTKNETNIDNKQSNTEN